MNKYDIKEYENACLQLAEAFRDRYFPDEAEVFCVSNDPTDVWCFGDFFFCVDKMYEFMKYGYNTEQLLNYYDYMENGGKVCIKAFKSLKGENDG